MTITEWARKWNVSTQALVELSKIGMIEDQSLSDLSSEAGAQTNLRLSASKLGIRLWRNNVGALKTKEGTWVRYGLCNESKAINERTKSSDLIGLRPLIITPEHVGTTVGQFVAREVKAPGWKFSRVDNRAVAQKRFLDLVTRMGGDAAFNNNGEMV